MDLAEMCERSFYQEIYRYEGTGRSIVLDTTTDHVYLKKELPVYNREVFAYLRKNRNPHIPEIHAFWEENGRLTVIEEFIQGKTLSSFLEKETPDKKEIQRILSELCDALEFLHKADPPIIHRDLKLSNVMLSDDGTIKLIDYDAAKLFHPEESQDTVLMGTKGSAAPEQYGFGQSDVRTDVYGLGMLIRKIAPDNPRLQKVADIATQIDPNNRYQSIDEVRRAIAGTIVFRQAGNKGAKESGNSHRFRIPGFRSGVWWKMITACIGYAVIADIALTSPLNRAGIEETNLAVIVVFRTCLALALLAVVDMFTEGSWIARHLPLRKSRSLLVWLLVHAAAALAGFFFWALVYAVVTEFM